jgi:hypothetical protein
MKTVRPVIVAAVLGCGLSPQLPAFAQAADDARQNAAVSVKNVPAGVMAWWLGASHNEMPSAFRAMFLLLGAPENGASWWHGRWSRARKRFSRNWSAVADQGLTAGAEWR